MAYGQGLYAYSALSEFPRALPPSPELATLTKQESAGKYYAENCYNHGSARNETQSQGIEPGTTLLLALRLTTKPLRRRNGLVVKRNANKSAVPGSIPWLWVSFLALP